MTDRLLTRRDALGALAGAGAIGLLRPDRALAALADPVSQRIRVRRVPLGTLPVGTTAVGPPRPGWPRGRVDLAGLEWAGSGGAVPRLRARVGSAWGQWTSGGCGCRGPDGDRHVGEPVWLGGAEVLQLRTDVALPDAVLHLVDVSGGRGARAATVPSATTAARLPLAGPVLEAGGGQPPIIARRFWARGHCPPAGPAAYGIVRMAFVHHTQTPNGYGAAEVGPMLRSIYAYHRFVQGWRDIGYNFVVDRFGRVFEARAGGIDEPVVGAQAGGYNLVSTGVAVLGDFVAVGPSTPAMRALRDTIAWKLALHGRRARGRVEVTVSRAGARYSRFPAGARVSLHRVAGHRDADSTECPGNDLYARLPALRARAAARAGPPAVVRLTGPPQAVVGRPFTVGGSLSLPGGDPYGAVVLIQARQLGWGRGPGQGGQPGQGRELTLATMACDGEGGFSAALTLAEAVPMRALHLGPPAAVSDPLEVAVAPALTLQASAAAVGGGQPFALSGTVSPALPRVQIVIARSDGGVARRLDVLTTGGVFTAVLSLPSAGVYDCIARTAATVRLAAGASAVVRLTVL